MRRFLQGLGLGLLVAAVVMGIGTRKNSSSADESIVEQARELGMVFPKDVKNSDSSSADDADFPTASPQPEVASGSGAKGAGIGGDTDSDSSQTTEPAATVSPEPTSGAKPKESDKPKETKKPKKDKKAKETDPPAEGPNATPRGHKVLEKGTVVRFKVRDGLVSSSIAREMYEQGIIEDYWDFDHYIVNHNLGNKIINGTYELKVGDSYANIARIITNG